MTLKRIAVAGISTLLVAAIAYGAWWAWDAGIVGNNPRAPAEAAMQNAVAMQMERELASQDSRRHCIVVNLQRPAPEIVGFPGIEQQPMPGQFFAGLTHTVVDRERAARDLQFAQLDYLATQDLLTSADDSSGKSYQLTWDGYAVLYTRVSNELCLRYGRRVFAGIEKIEKTTQQIAGFEMYDVTYRTHVIDIPAWAANAEAQRLFPTLADQLADAHQHMNLVRGGDGWHSGYELMTAAFNAAAAGYAMPIANALLPASLTLDDVLARAPAFMADPEWVSFNGMACLRFDLRRGGDEKPTSNAGPFTVTFFDRNDRYKNDYTLLAAQLHLLSAFQAAGLATMEPVSGASPGVRYQLTDEGAAALELKDRSGCIPAGKIKVALLSLANDGGEAEILGRATVERTPDWVKKVAGRLPALRAILDFGLPIRGLVSPAGQTPDPGDWRIAAIFPVYPKLHYTSIPADLIPLLPLTAAAMGPAPAAQPIPILSEPRRADRVLVTTPEKIQPAATEAPYPAGNADVHVISVYQPAGDQNSSEHGEGHVDLNVSAPNAYLLLVAYEPTEWRVHVAGDGDIARVLVSGAYEQRVTFPEGGATKVVISPWADFRRAGGLSRDGFPRQQDGNDLVDVARITQTLSGVAPTTFQASYTAPTTGYSIDAQTPRFKLPSPRSPQTSAGDVVLNTSAGGGSSDGHHVMRGISGAYSEGWADRAYSAGKVYFEATMNVTGAMSSHTFADVGVCLMNKNSIETMDETTVIPRGQEKLYGNGDVFGIAADFDRQRLYFRVNDDWITGEPGSNDGIALERGKSYRACAFTAGTTSGDVKRGKTRSDTTWEINFGERPFVDTVPQGYVAYRGGVPAGS